MRKLFHQFLKSLQYAKVYLYRRIWRFPKARPFLRKCGELLRIIEKYFDTHPRARRWAKITAPPLAFLFLLIFLIWVETPGNRELRNIQNQVASEVYSADSVLLGRYFLEDRTEIKYEDISPAVIDALISTEDIRFYSHSGVDYKSLGRVLIKSIIQQDESAGGGSTLTQQLAKNLYPRKRYWILPMLLNKLREVRIARKLESIYTKEQLLTLYLNTVPFADNVFGIQAAAERFYSISARDLKTDQAALLVGMLKATHSYNPRLFPDRALVRRNVVLRQMVKYNKLDSITADSLKALPVELEYNKISFHEGLAPYFREYVKSELMTWCANHEKEDGTPYNLYTDGLKIYTTIDSRLQEFAETAMVQQMTEIQKTFFDHWGKQKPWKGKEEVLEQAIQRSTRYQKLVEQGLSEEDILAELQKPVPMLIFTWEGVKETTISPLDSIIHHLQYLNAGFLALDPANGKVKAWVGGIDHDFFQFDHVKESTKRQVGSIFKPIVFAMALEEGVEPCELISAERQTYIDKEGEKWTPRNSQVDYEVEYSMRGALAYSVNTVAVKLIEMAGVKNTIDLARKMGITSDMPEVPSISLGASSISLLEMTAAYSCIANNGLPNTPYFIGTIQDLDGKIYEDFKPEAKTEKAMSSETAALVTNMMRTVVTEGTASRLRWKYGVLTDVAGKTGTTQANADGWFMAITPNLVMGSWVGADDPRIRFRSTELGQGSNTALPITGYFLKQMNKDPKFKKLSDAKFPPLSASLQEKLNCDLYELSDTLQAQIRRIIFKRDSTILADTLVAPPPESFLQVIYQRKLKMQKVLHQRDSIRLLEVEIIEGDNDPEK
ncbi:MAG: penicillin-binding protein [Cyclobacteriaceae bacterium]|nr:penicillin-binding protein [Cyclobacteriaceae bacterium]